MMKWAFNRKSLVNINFYAITSLALILPYLGLLSIFNHINIFAVLSKELLVIIIIFISLISGSRIPKVFYCFILLMILSITASLYLGQGAKAILLGVKYDFIPFILLLSLTAGSLISSKRAKLLIRILTYNAAILSFIAIWQQLFPSWWEYIGFNSSNVNPYQLVDPALDWIRSFVFSAGPNQFALYLLLILGVNLYYPQLFPHRAKHVISMAIISVGIMMTFSRSALVAMAFILLFKVFLSMRLYINSRIKLSLILAGVLICIIPITVLAYKNIGEGSKIGYFIHHGRIVNSELQGSDGFRQEALKLAVQGIEEKPLLGHGLSSIGPGALHNGYERVSENWFLQIIYELGIPLALIYYYLIYQIWGYLGLGSKAFFAIVAPIMIVGLFLHSFSDSMIGYSSAILLALLYKVEDKSQWAK